MVSMMKHRRRSAACALALWFAFGVAPASSPIKLNDSDSVMLADFADRNDPVLQRALREALRVALDESPYLNLVPDAAIESALSQSSASVPAAELARVCRTLRARVYLNGVLARAPQGASFQGQLNAVDCVQLPLE